VGVEVRLHHLSGMSLINTMIGVANLLIHGEVIDLLHQPIRSHLLEKLELTIKTVSIKFTAKLKLSVML